MQGIWALSLVCLLADPAGGSGWHVVGRNSGVVVFARERPGESVRELKAIGYFDAPPQAVWSVIRDWKSYPHVMPYTAETKLMHSEQDGGVIWVYNVVAPPFVDRRDYTLRVTDDSNWQDGKGYLQSSWTLGNDKGPPERPGIVRVKVNDGFWRLEPRDGGKRTFATYYLHTDPGGSLPPIIANQANTNGMPDVFRAIRDAVRRQRR